MALYVFYVQPQRKGKLVGNGIHHQHRFLGIDCIFYLGGGCFPNVLFDWEFMVCGKSSKYFSISILFLNKA